MLHIHELSRGDVMVLKLSGRPAASASELEIRDRIRRVLARGYRKVIVDLTAVSNAIAAEDGVFLGPLVDGRGIGAEIKLVHPDRTTTDLTRSFSVFESEMEALDSFAIERPSRIRQSSR